MDKKTRTLRAILIALFGIGMIGMALYGFRGTTNEVNVPEGLHQVGGGYRGKYLDPAVVIVRTNEGYEPNAVTIQKGETVSFLNRSDEFHWPASDVHPTHSIYSEFDPREPIAPGEIWSFTFTQTGDWDFHDHIRANKRGVVHVTE